MDMTGNDPDQLITAEQAAKALGASVSWWLEHVRKGAAPQPVVRRPRFTRWRLADVRVFRARFIAHASSSVAAAVTDRAIKASRAARARRLTVALVTEG